MGRKARRKEDRKAGRKQALYLVPAQDGDQLRQSRLGGLRQQDGLVEGRQASRCVVETVLIERLKIERLEVGAPDAQPPEAGEAHSVCATLDMLHDAPGAVVHSVLMRNQLLQLHVAAAQQRLVVAV